MTGHPRRWPLYHLRPAAAALLRRRFDVRFHGTEHVPTDGPVILASNHTGIIDGPLLAILSPRPAHALTKVEMFEGNGGRFMRFSGQIPLDRFVVDREAIRIAQTVLAEGHVVGIFPEGSRGLGDLSRFHGGAAYLAAVTGAPVVPTVMLGTRLPGQGLSSVPPRGSRIDIVYGAAWRTAQVDWPRTQTAVRDASTALREHMRVLLHDAMARTGRQLPEVPPEDEGVDND